MLTRDNMHEYQNKAVQFIKDEKRCALFLGLGLGKSVSSLTAATDLLDGLAVNKVLVVAPLRVANSVWAQECKQWQHLEHLRVNVCTGTEKKRIAALQAHADIYTINRENITWLVQHYGKKWPFDCVIIDESSSFKNASSKRFKSLKKVAPLTTHMILLTGTPSPNGLLDLWPQMHLVDFGERLGRTMTSYKQRFFETDFMGYKFTPREGSDKKIQSLIADKCLSMSAADYLQMPDRIDIIEPVTLPPAILKQYNDFERELFAEIEGEEIEALSAASLANKLLQWSNGTNYTDDKGNWVEIHKAKLDALKDIVSDNDNENILLAYNFKSDLARLQKAFPDAVTLDKDQETIERWNRGEIKMLMAHPASTAYGLNLQKGGSMIVWFGLNWSLELYQQFNGRLHRQGQDKPVRIVHLVANDCIDERVMRTLSDKDVVQSDLLKALKCT